MSPLCCASPYAPGILLALAASLGGLRSPLSWVVFSVFFFAWFLLSGRRLRAGGRNSALLFFCWMAAAALFSPDPAFSFSVLAKYAVFAALFFSASAAEEDGWLFSVLAIGLAASAVFIFQKASGLGAAGFMGANPNYTAAFAAAAFPAALLTGFEAIKGSKKNLMFILAGFIALGLAASGSRGAIGAAFLSAAAGLAVSGRRRALTVFLLAAVSAFVLLPADFIGGLLKFSDPRAFERPRLWSAALQAAAASPLTGWGPGLFVRAFEFFKFPYFDGVSFYGHSTLHAHGELFNLAAEAGFPAAIFFLAAAVQGFSRGGTNRLPLKLCALAVFLQGGTDIIFYSGAVSLLFWGSLGLASAGEAAVSGGNMRLKALLAAACVAALGSAALPVAPASPEKGARLYPEAALAGVRLQAINKPRDPFSRAAEGDILYSLGDLRGAGAAYKRALSLEPFFAGARLGLARVYAASGRPGPACSGLKLAEKSGLLKAQNGYDRSLIFLEPKELERLNRDLCRKK